MRQDADKYTYVVQWSEEDGRYVGRCVEFPSVSGHGETPEEALRQVHVVIEESLSWLEEKKQPVPEPLGMRKYSGHLTLRVPPDTHRELSFSAAEQGVSLNQFITSVLEKESPSGAIIASGESVH